MSSVYSLKLKSKRRRRTVAEIECTVALHNSAARVPNCFGDLSWLADCFAEASRNAIRLRFNNRSGAPHYDDPSAKTSSYELNDLTRVLTGNPINLNRVDHVALIVANKYKAKESVFGIMFDLGFSRPGEVVNPDFKAVPREGCAIFTGAIAERRLTREEFEDECKYASTHEMGHIFNLPHLPSPASYMQKEPQKYDRA